MSNNVKKAAKKLYKQLKGNITFEAVKAHLNKLSYKIMFFNTKVGDAELERYRITEKAQQTNAFTYCGSAKIIFINGLLSAEDKFYLLLHEVAHIVLKHLEPGKISMTNGILLDIDADAFIHYLLNPQQSPRRAIAICSFLAIAATSTIFYNYTIGTNTASVSNIITQPADIVYITSTGDKFHTPTCGTIIGKATARIERDEALKIHPPCKMCNP